MAEPLTCRTSEAAGMLGVSENTLRAMTRAGKIMALPCAGTKRPRVRYAREELQRFLREGPRPVNTPGEPSDSKRRRRRLKSVGQPESRWKPRPV